MSDKYIKREDAMTVAIWFGKSKESYSIPFIKKRVMELPSADVVEVVWCKYCRHCEYEQANDMYVCTKLKFHMYDTNHFCSYGERKDDE